MGTNYYLRERAACDCCGRGYEGIHIGKSSGGWCFSLHVIPEDGINDLEDWRVRFSKPGAVIEDEYGQRLSPEEMIAVIANRSYPTLKNNTFDYAANYAEPGPNGLARNKVGRDCLRHGVGTWDCILGEFS